MAGHGGRQGLMRVAAHLFAAAFLLLAPGFSGAQAAAPCTGKDVIAEMRQADPVAHRRLIAAGDRLKNGEGLFWRIERQGLAPSFLFGTMHATDARATDLPPVLRRALSGVDTVAVESLDALDPERSAEALKQSRAFMLYADGRGLAERLTPGRRAELERALAPAGIKLEQAGTMKPWMLAVALSVPACETARRQQEKYVDAVLSDLARAEGKRLVGLETMPEQLASFDAIDERLQIEFLISAARLAPRMNDVFVTMTNLYLEGRIGRLKALSIVLAEQTGVSRAANDAFNRELIDLRNGRMFARALPLVEKGPVLIGVGALHLPGESGLVQLFRDAGFTVNRLY
jgi:hypothetical protein